ncbi:hypothetical protein BH18ACT11_BH18ACT11_08220 [soil metagenome]
MPPAKTGGKIIGRMGLDHPEDGYVRQVERVARGVGVSSAGQSVGRFLASFEDAVRDTFGREPAR